MDRNEQHGKGVEGGVKGQRGERKEKKWWGEKKQGGESARITPKAAVVLYMHVDPLCCFHRKRMRTHGGCRATERLCCLHLLS